MQSSTIKATPDERVALLSLGRGLTVGVLNPQRDAKKTSWISMRTADFYWRIRTGALQASLFPPILTDANGTIVKPASR